MNCNKHPKITTKLKCHRCETPICPKCLVQSDVGFKCIDCHKLSLPNINTISYPIQSILITTMCIIGALSGIFIKLIQILIILPAIIHIIYWLALGYMLSTISSKIAKGKRSIRLVWITSMGIAFSYITSQWFLFNQFNAQNSTIEILAVAGSIYIIYLKLR
mgnify:FL=1